MKLRDVRPAALVLCAGLALAALAAPALSLESPAPTVPTQKTWRHLTSPSFIWPADGAIYYSFETVGGSHAHLIVVDMQSGKWSLAPRLNEATAPLSSTVEDTGASAAVNAGFFNLSDGVSASYVVVDGKTVADPRTNKALTDNPKLAPYLETIFQRSELRVLENGEGKRSLAIAAHDSPLPEGYKLIHCLQGGPRLLPELRVAEEAFVRKNPDGTPADSIGARRPAARTAIGLTPDGYAMLICVAGKGQDPQSSGITLAGLANLLKELGCSEALNLDGGASSGMVVRRQPSEPVENAPAGAVVCGKTPPTKVKSVLLLQRAVSEP